MPQPKQRAAAAHSTSSELELILSKMKVQARGTTPHSCTHKKLIAPIDKDNTARKNAAGGGGADMGVWNVIIRTKHGKCFACSCLPIGEDGGIETLRDAVKHEGDHGRQEQRDELEVQ